MAERDRVVVLIDMDCFYCQVEEKIDPSLKGKPIAVVQYNKWQGGGIIAVNYKARELGVTRHMRGDEAKEKCPDIELPSVPCLRGKADISKYRDAGKDVAHVLQGYTPLLERASIDEAYLDITDLVDSQINQYCNSNSILDIDLINTFILGYDNVKDFISDVYDEDGIESDLSGFDEVHSKQLLVGAIITNRIRKAVYEKTGYQCSAGIAHNKIMAKLVCGFNKPNKQTVLPKNQIKKLFESLAIGKVRSLGGKFGKIVCEKLKISTMSELLQFSEKELHSHFDEKNGTWLFNIARGIDKDHVVPRFSSKSIGCCKKFAGKSAILDLPTLTHWLNELGNEIEDRLNIDFIENNRHPTQMVVSFTRQSNGQEISKSRSVNMSKEDIMHGSLLSENALFLIKNHTKPFCISDSSNPNNDAKNPKILANPIKYLGISVGKFERVEEKSKGILNFFNIQKMAESKTNIKQQSSTITTAQVATEVKEQQQQEVPSISISSISNEYEPLASKMVTSENKEEINQNPVLLENLPSTSSFFLKCMSAPKTLSEPIKNTNIQDSFSCRPNKSTISNPTELMDNLDDQNSNDSECSVELEIKKSRLMPDQPTVYEESPEIKNLRNTFSVEKFFGKGLDSNESSPLKSDDDISFQCSKCNKHIAEKDLTMHEDYHYALAIKEEERRNIPKIMPLERPDSKQNAKKKQATKVSPKSQNIVTLLNKSNKDSDVVKSEHEVGEICTECGKNIEISRFQEHMDFHEARRLHDELNKSNSPNPGTSSNKNTATNKRKRSTESVKIVKKNDNLNTIESYFQK